MPIRRPPASTGLPDSSKAHRSNDSHHGLGNGLAQPPSIAYSAASATPQQKNVQALINGIKNKLPVNSGLALDVVEGDPATQGTVDALVELAYDSLDIIAWSLGEFLERLAKQIDAAGAMTTEALPIPTLRNNNAYIPSPSTWHSRTVHKPSSEFSSPTPPLPLVEIDPLDHNRARYVLSVMVYYLRQTAALILHELSSLLVGMKRQAQVVVAIPLRMALWNWVELYPQEYNEAVRTRGKLEGSAERVFDLLYIVNEPGREASSLAHADRSFLFIGRSTDYRLSNRHPFPHCRLVAAPKVFFPSKGRRLSDVAFSLCQSTCVVQVPGISPEGELPLRHLAMDIAHEIKMAILGGVKQTPFWDSFDKIDIGTYAEALVAVFRFLPEDESAASILALEADRLPWQPSMENLRRIIALRSRRIYEVPSIWLLRVVTAHVFGQIALIYRTKRFTSETLTDKDLLLLAILALWRADPSYSMLPVDEEDSLQWGITFTRIWDSEVDTSVKISAATTFQCLVDMFFRMSAEDPDYAYFEDRLKHSLATVLTCQSKKLLMTRLEADSQKLWISVCHQVMETYHRRSQGDHAKIQFNPDRVPAFALSEISFLVLLSSLNSEVSQLAAQGLRLIAQAECHPDALVNMGLTGEEWSKRNLIYEQLGDPGVVVVGRVREQKRVRKLLHLRWSALSEFVVPNPLASIAAFDEIYLSKQEQGLLLEEKFFQWRNLALFLAAFGGATVHDEHDEHEPGALTAVILAEFLPDEMRVLRDPGELNISIEFLTAALVDDTILVREVVREALGSELSPRPFARLFKHLDKITRNITEGACSEFKDEYGLFLDQSAARMLTTRKAHIGVEISR
ncbi:hypothetical protein J3R83DRAFT_3247 [Lanmaoa asiatica]|nr:hypothetical protein J3R83DRAFT_3247 [Lanmaoa asiatica]